MPPDRVAAIIGDLAEDAATRGSLWFWWSVLRIAGSQFLRNGVQLGRRSTGTKSGLLTGTFWVALVAGGNLGGGAFVIWFGLGLLLVMVMTGMTIAERTGSIKSALRVGLHSGVLSGAICFVGLLAFTALFLNVMMRDPANIRDFVRHAGHQPSRVEFSSFLYRDALGGALNMLWISPLLTILLGTAGAVFGRAMHRNDEKRKLL
jgi:hypothetical protein